VLLALDVLIVIVRRLVFVAGAATAVLALLAWLVRTRRLNPFGGPARLVRRVADPLFAPVERRILRAGGVPTHAPWWGLAAVVVGGIVLVSVLGFVRGQLAGAAYAVGAGPRGLLLLLVSWTFSVLKIALFARVISSWFQLSPYSPWIRWAFTLTEWLLRPLRQVIPPLGMVDVTPIVAYFVLWLLESFVRSVL
jgi:YggT family protein